MFPLKLERPLAVFDIEATGTSPRADRIVELAVIRVHPGGSRDTHVFRVNPQVPIPEEASRIHGIKDEDVADCPPFAGIAHRVLELLDNCDLAGFNILRYDIPLLAEEFIRAGLDFDPVSRRVVDAQRIFHRKEPRDLSAALSYYCGEMHLDAHGAEADALATLRVLESQLRKYSDLPHDVAELDDYCNPRDPTWADRTGRLKWSDGKLVINFGRKKGTPLATLIEHDTGFIKWMLRADFPRDTREIVEAATRGTWPSPPNQATSG